MSNHESSQKSDKHDKQKILDIEFIEASKAKSKMPPKLKLEEGEIQSKPRNSLTPPNTSEQQQQSQLSNNSEKS